MRIGYSNSGGGGGEKCPPGGYVAVLAACYDIGRQERAFKDEKKVAHQVILVWEVDKRDSKGRRFTMIDYVTASTNEKSGMFKRVGALIGRPPTDDDFDDSRLVGRCCYVMVSPPRVADGWPRLGEFIPLPNGMSPIKAEFNPEPTPRYVENARAKAVGGWKAPPATAPASISSPAPKAEPRDEIPF